MPRTCLTCQHPEKREIDRLLVQNLHPIAAIARQFDISAYSLRHHKKSCLHGNLVAAQERRDCTHQDELLEIYQKSITRLNRDIDVLEELIPVARKKGHLNTLTKLMQAVRQSVELSFKLLMSINTTQNVERDFDAILNDERLNEILASCPTSDLIGFRRVLAKLVDRTSVPLIEIQSGGEMGVDGEHILGQEEDEDEDQDNYKPYYIRTTTPPRAGEDLERDKRPHLDSRDQLNAESVGHEDDGVDMDKPDREGLTQHQRERKRPWNEVAW